MAPIRRYLRISKYSVLECRIYLENPSDTRWLLDSRDPILPRIFASIRPLVLPKIREENERLFSRKKGKPVKDVIAEDEFEVSIFFRESRTRHTLLTRHKTFAGAENELRGRTQEKPGSALADNTGILVESDDSEADTDLRNIPQASADGESDKRQRETERSSSPGNQRASKRRRGPETSPEISDDNDDDKKLNFRTKYEGFNIYGWTLCLLVTRKGDKVKTKTAPSEPSRQALMEEWISTQAQGDLDEE